MIIRVSNRLAIDFRCRNCKGYLKNVDNQKGKLHNDVESLTELSYLGDRINSEGECETAVTCRTRIGWVEFRDCHDLLCRKNFL